MAIIDKLLDTEASASRDPLAFASASVVSASASAATRDGDEKGDVSVEGCPACVNSAEKTLFHYHSNYQSYDVVRNMLSSQCIQLCHCFVFLPHSFVYFTTVPLPAVLILLFLHTFIITNCYYCS